MTSIIKEKLKTHKTMEELEREFEEFIKSGGKQKKRKYKKVNPDHCGSGRKIGRNYPEDYFG